MLRDLYAKKSIGFAWLPMLFFIISMLRDLYFNNRWNCDFSRFLPDFEPFVLVSPDFWICGL